MTRLKLRLDLLAILKPQGDRTPISHRVVQAIRVAQRHGRTITPEAEAKLQALEELWGMANEANP